MKTTGPYLWGRGSEEVSPNERTAIRGGTDGSKGSGERGAAIYGIYVGKEGGKGERGAIILFPFASCSLHGGMGTRGHNINRKRKRGGGTVSASRDRRRGGGEGKNAIRFGC